MKPAAGGHVLVLFKHAKDVIMWKVEGILGLPHARVVTAHVEMVTGDKLSGVMHVKLVARVLGLRSNFLRYMDFKHLMQVMQKRDAFRSF